MATTSSELISQIEALRDEVKNGSITASRLGVILEELKYYIDENDIILDGGKIPSSLLPSYVDDIEEYSTRSAFPTTGTAGKIYCALDTNVMYRWGSSTYVEISSSLSIGETSGTAYDGAKGKANADAIKTMQSKLSGIESGAEKNEDGTVVDADYVHTDNNYTSKEKSKLSGIEEGAQVNPGVVTSTENGLMSIKDKAKLDDIEEGAQKNDTGTVVDEDYVHTDNNFTDEHKEKLDTFSVNSGTTTISNDTVNIEADEATVNGEDIVVESDINIPFEHTTTKTEKEYQSDAELARTNSDNKMVISGASGDIVITTGTMARNTEVYRSSGYTPVFHIVPVGDDIGYVSVVDASGNSFGHVNTSANEIWFSLDELQGKTITITEARSFVVLLKTACYVTVTHTSGSVEYKKVTDVVKENIARLDTLKDTSDTEVLTGSTDDTPNASDISGGTSNTVTSSSSSLSVTTVADDAKKCHWIAVKASSPYRVTKIEDINTNSLMDDTRFLMLGEYYVWCYLSEMNIDNTTTFYISK